MNASVSASAPDPFLTTLAEFRYELRRFLIFSESAAQNAGLHPQQHQLLLQVAGAPEGTAVTIAYAAERLGLRHNSAVELVDRSVREGLLTRRNDPGDKRRALLHITHRGRQVLGRLSDEHARELNELAPRLERSLKHIRLHSPAAA
jgi:DNA-binding MarR family transcriptional regulator